MICRAGRLRSLRITSRARPTPKRTRPADSASTRPSVKKVMHVAGLQGQRRGGGDDRLGIDPQGDAGAVQDGDVAGGVQHVTPLSCAGIDDAAGLRDRAAPGPG